MINRVVVLGGGSAGFLAAISLKVKIPALHVTVLRSKDIGVIGVGESTTPNLTSHLFGFLGFDPGEVHRLANASWKLGIRFLWGKRPFFDYTFGQQLDWKYHALPRNNGFYCEHYGCVDISSALMSHDRVFLRRPNGDPLITRNFALHLENETFVRFLEGRAEQVGVQILDDTLAEVLQNEHGLTGLRLASGGTLEADLFVDCSGFRSLLLGKALAEPFISYKSTLFCDRALVGSWERTDEPVQPYTTAETMDAGWCWRIDHHQQINRGYVFGSSFLSDDAAEREMRAKNPRLGPTRFIQFPSGRYQTSWVKNVVAIGNAYGFVEPLEATALHVICDESRFLVQVLLDCGCQPTRTLIETYNRLVAIEWDEIRSFLSVHYRFNNRLDTPFWRACRADVDLAGAKPVVEYYEENGPSTFGRNIVLGPKDIFGMEGYLSLLVGQQVPYRQKPTPSEAEWHVWNTIRSEHSALAQNGLTIPEAFAAITAPRWTWNPAFFRDQ